VPAGTPVKVELVPEPVVVVPGVLVKVQVPEAGKPLNSTLPVVSEQVGCVIVPTIGAVGVAAMRTALADTTEVHPSAFFTVKAYVPAAKLDIVLLAPVPDIAPGLIVQFPDAGKPFNTTLPVAREQVGCVIVPNMGADGVGGCAFMTKEADAKDMHPATLVTVIEYVPGNNPDSIVVVPEPVLPPGLIVQFPAGKPDNATLPVATVQVGCVTVPIVGVAGVPALAVITTLADAKEVHPASLVTV